MKKNTTHSAAEHLSLCPEQLIAGKRNYVTLSPLFEAAVDREKAGALSMGYMVRDGLFMCKWTPLSASIADNWSVETAIVVPAP